MDNIIDARNLNCPEPVIMTKKAIDNNPNINLITIVSENAAKENVTRLATNHGYNVEVEEKEDGIYLYLNKDKEDLVIEVEKGELAILVTSQFFGQGDEELGKILMNSFLYTLTEMTGQIKNLIFMNAGVYLVCEGSPVIENLQALQENGVEILACGTCLDFYDIKDKLAVGRVTNMYTAMEILANASKNITL